jgi:autotransporter-associated beta strand protein
LLLLAAGALAAAQRSAQAQSVWDGGGATDVWSDAANWNNNALPASTADVTFGTGFGSGTSITLGASDRTVNSLTINTATGFSIDSGSTGSRYLILTSGDLTRIDTPNAEGNHTLENVRIGANGLWDISGSGRLIIEGRLDEVSGSHSITKAGPGTLEFEVGSMAYSGGTTVLGGTLLCNSSQPGSGRVTVGAAGTLILNGSEESGPLGGNYVYTMPLTLLGHGAGGAGVLRTQISSEDPVTVTAPVTLLGDVSIGVDGGAGLALEGNIVDGASGYSLTKVGTGDLQLSGINSFGGGISVNAGRLTVNSDASFGSGPFAMASGTVLHLNMRGSDRTLNRDIRLRGTLSAGGLTEAIAGEITLLEEDAAIVGHGGALTDWPRITGTITDGPTFRRLRLNDGLRLVTANTYDGGTLVEGRVRVEHPSALGTGAVSILEPGGELFTIPGLVLANPIVLENSVVHAGGNATLSGPITLATAQNTPYPEFRVDGGTLTISGPVTDGAASLGLVAWGPGRLVLSGVNNFDEMVTVANNAVLEPRNNAAVGVAGVNVLAGSAVEVNDGFSVNGPIALNGDGGGAGALRTASHGTWAGPVAANGASIGAPFGATLTLAGPVTGAFTKTGLGTLSLTVASPAAGAITVAQGTLVAGHPDATGSASLVAEPIGSVAVAPGVTVNRPISIKGMGPFSAGSLRGAGGSSAFAGPITLAADGSIGADADATFTVSGVIDDGPNAFKLTKVGPGTVVLTAANTHKGGTSVEGGTLRVSSDAALGHPAGPVAVHNGASLQFAATLATPRTFNLTSGSIDAPAGVTVTYNAASINGGSLQGAGAHHLAAGTLLRAVTALPGSKVTTAGLVSASNLTNSGNVTVPAGSTLGWLRGYNTSAGTLTVHGALTLGDFENTGNILVSAGGSVASLGPLVSGGGTITLDPGGSMALGGGALDLYNTLAVNNGAISGGAVNVRFGAVLAGIGSFPNVALHPGGQFLPGQSLGNIPEAGPLSTGMIAPLEPDQSVDAGVELAGDASAVVSAEHHSLTLTGLISGPGKVLTKSGPGLLTVGGFRVGKLALAQGTVRASGEGEAAVNAVDELNIAGVPGAWGATLDLGGSDLVVHDGDIASVISQLRSGRAGGAWNGAGLASSAAAADPSGLTAPGAVLNDDGGGKVVFETFAGEAVDASAVLVMYTYYGDADLSGAVDGDDYMRSDRGFLDGGEATWLSGDFDYDRRVSISDYFLLDRSNAMQQGGLGGLPAAVAAIVPEPAAAGAVAALSLLAARRRRR